MQNWGPPPRTTPIGGKNFQPDAMNPDLWPVFNDEGRRMINARIRPENTRLMGGGLDAFNLVNSPYGKSIGLGYKQAEAGIQGIRSGMPDPNRALFNLNPYAAQAPVQPQGPNPDQMRWAQAFANAQQAPAGLPPPPAANNPATPFTNSLFTNGMRSNFVQQNPVAAGIPRGPLDRGTPTAPATTPPTNFSRAALIEGAKKSGEFKDIMTAYNREAQGTGYRMDENGNIAKTPENYRKDVLQPMANDIAARRDFARGEAPVQKFDPMAGPNADEMNPQPMQFSKMNPYGGATVISAPSKGGMMRHEITGKMVPMSPYLAEKRAIQDTKIKPLGAQDANRFRDLVRKGRMA